MNNDKILSVLQRLRPLFSSVVDCPQKLLSDLAISMPTRYMIFPCDILDLRRFLLKDSISFFNPIPLFSLRFAEKYLKDYSVFLVLDAKKVAVETFKYGGLQLNFTDEMDISKLLHRIIVNEPSSEGNFDTVKQMVEELNVGVECLVSNSVPGISVAPYGKFSIQKKEVYKFSQTTEITLTPLEEKIFAFLRQKAPDGVQMRVAGGWVRDKLLGKESDDIDIAVDMPGYELARMISPTAHKVSLEKSADPAIEAPNDELMVGGVNLFGQKIEFVPMRTEYYPEADSRQPAIQLTKDPQEDVKRRDLTINAIYYNILTGQIEDYVGGKKDLGLDGSGQITLRTPDEPFKTFHEDPLRLLRVLRFHARYPNSVVDPSIIEAMADPSIQESYAKKVATERAGPEIMKMVAGEDPVDSLRLLFESGLYKTVFKVPEMEKVHEQGIQMDQQTPWHTKNLMGHILEVVKNMNQISKDNGDDDYKRGLMNLAALFHDFGKMQEGIRKAHPKGNLLPDGRPQMQYLGHEKASTKMCNAILKSIGVGKEDRDIVNQIVRLHMRPHNAMAWSPKGIGRFIRDTIMHGKEEEHKGLAEDIMRFNKADEMSSNPDNFNEEEWQAKYDKVVNFRKSPSGSFKGTVINGNDIIGLFPTEPRGPWIQDVLNYVKEQQDSGAIDISGDINVAKQQAIRLVQQVAPQMIGKYKEPTMGRNWFKKVVTAQSVPAGPVAEKDPEVVKGPKEAIPPFEVGMRVRDRRMGVANPQEYGKVKAIKDNRVKIVWNPDNKKTKREEIFDMVKDLESLLLIVAEV